MGSKFFERYTELCKSIGETPNSIGKQLGFSSGSITAWKKGTVPGAGTLTKISTFFDVSTDYLLGNEDDRTSFKRDVLDEVDIAFYGDFKELDEEQKETVRDMVRVMRERRSKKQEK